MSVSIVAIAILDARGVEVGRGMHQAGGKRFAVETAAARRGSRLAAPEQQPSQQGHRSQAQPAPDVRHRVGGSSGCVLGRGHLRAGLRRGLCGSGRLDRGRRGRRGGLVRLGQALLGGSQFAVLERQQLLLVLLQFLEFGHPLLELADLDGLGGDVFVFLPQLLLEHAALASGGGAGSCTCGLARCSGRDDLQARFLATRGRGLAGRRCRFRLGRGGGRLGRRSCGGGSRGRRPRGRRGIGSGDLGLAHRTARLAPLLHLLAHHLPGFVCADAAQFIASGDAQHRTATQPVDVIAQEGIRIGAQQGQHRLVKAVARRQVQLAGDFRQRLALLDRTVLRGGRCWRCGDRSRCGSRWWQRRDGDGRWRGFRARLGNRRRRGHGRGGNRWRHRPLDHVRHRRHRGFDGRLQRRACGIRRVDQRRVFAHQPTLSPIDLDQEVQHGLFDRAGAGNPDHRTAAGIAAQAELQVCGGAAGRRQADPPEGFRRGQPCLQRFQFPRRGRNDRDFRDQRLVAPRLDLDLAEAERPRIPRRQQQRSGDCRRSQCPDHACSRPHHRDDSSRAQASAATSSAICTAFSAAPLRMLSETTHRFSPRGCDRSSRIRPT